MRLWYCWKDLDGQDELEFIGNIWIQIVGNIDLKVISNAENSNNSKKPGFGRKDQLRTW
jgi:hypothetical protein